MVLQAEIAVNGFGIYSGIYVGMAGWDEFFALVDSIDPEELRDFLSDRNDPPPPPRNEIGED